MALSLALILFSEVLTGKKLSTHSSMHRTTIIIIAHNILMFLIHSMANLLICFLLPQGLSLLLSP